MSPAAASAPAPGPGARPRPLSPAVRFAVLAPLAVGSGYTALVLTLAPSLTRALFPWTMSPVTAVLLGAAYAGSWAMLWLAAARAEQWARARVTVATSSLFMLLALAATLLGRGTLHLRSGDLSGVLAAWGWLGVHLCAPLIGLVAFGFQWYARGAEPPRPEPLPGWVSAPMLASAALLGPTGLWLFVEPALTARHWAWHASQLDVRMLGAWSLAFGVAMLLAHRERELRRVRHGMVALVLTGLLGLVGMLRYAGSVHWGSPAAWAVVAALTLLLGMGLSGLGLAPLLSPPPPAVARAPSVVN
ncbi:hypothetical protein GXW83_12615 [Streptacidiphilus sp. PB12-B1b]|uniref:hypothetical protein n=1 Tax=Streptacidiphilus sp. PB12-B1b TaxID=2705012 RepID=UPI0015FE419D|nr:hypothetical protein [Streptacidiphilus sp. PB12-B1b]QMU76457.1 hypothetical protein GXW83_12615 [Streptacidiphilus sp. PB12-B1b]